MDLFSSINNNRLKQLLCDLFSYLNFEQSGPPDWFRAMLVENKVKYKNVKESIYQVMKTITDFNVSVNDNVFGHATGLFINRLCGDGDNNYFQQLKDFCSFIQFTYSEFRITQNKFIDSGNGTEFTSDDFVTMEQVNLQDNIIQAISDRLYDKYMDFKLSYECYLVNTPETLANATICNHEDKVECITTARKMASLEMMRFISTPSAIYHWRKRVADKYVSDRGDELQPQEYMRQANLTITNCPEGQNQGIKFISVCTQAPDDPAIIKLTFISYNKKKELQTDPHTIVSHYIDTNSTKEDNN